MEIVTIAAKGNTCNNVNTADDNVVLRCTMVGYVIDGLAAFRTVEQQQKIS